MPSTQLIETTEKFRQFVGKHNEAAKINKIKHEKQLANDMKSIDLSKIQKLVEEYRIKYAPFAYSENYSINNDGSVNFDWVSLSENVCGEFPFRIERIKGDFKIYGTNHQSLSIISPKYVGGNFVVVYPSENLKILELKDCIIEGNYSYKIDEEMPKYIGGDCFCECNVDFPSLFQDKNLTIDGTLNMGLHIKETEEMSEKLVTLWKSNLNKIKNRSKKGVFKSEYKYLIDRMKIPLDYVTTPEQISLIKSKIKAKNYNIYCADSFSELRSALKIEIKNRF